jgi:hypothetical protein
MIATPQTPFKRFRAAVMADPAAQSHLAEPFDPALFEARAIAWATTQGIALTTEDLAECGRPDPIGMFRISAAPVTQLEWPSGDWLPAGFAQGSEPAIQWLHFAGTSHGTPFFEEAVRRVANLPFNRMFRTTTPLSGFVGRTGLRAPSGFIFHMSRCGSTLVSQLLGAAPGHVSISETSVLDSVIRHPFDDPAAHADALRALVHAYGRGAEHLFLKLDSWHTRALPLLRRAFPDTPWIFLYRDPVEVLVSQRRMRGAHTVPGMLPPEWFGLGPEDAHLPELDFIARVLERTCGAVLEHGLAGGLLVNYSELPDAFFERILPHFRITPDPDALAGMTAATRRDSKAPETAFTADAAAKQREADPELRAAANRYIAPVFAELEALRRAT